MLALDFNLLYCRADLSVFALVRHFHVQLDGNLELATIRSKNLTVLRKLLFEL